MSRQRSLALVAFGFVTLALLTAETAAQVTNLTVTPDPAGIGATVTITVNATNCAAVQADFGDGTTYLIFQPSAPPLVWPQFIQHTYGPPAGTKNLTATGYGPSSCVNQLSTSLTLVQALPAQITSVVGCFEPGCMVAAYGTGFDYPCPQLRLNGNFPRGFLLLTQFTGSGCIVNQIIDGVRQDVIWGTIDPFVSGVPDQLAALQVITTKGMVSNPWTVPFLATRDLMALPAAAAPWQCGLAGYHDYCQIQDPYGLIVGYHDATYRTRAVVGTDTYYVALKNGWVLDLTTQFLVWVSPGAQASASGLNGFAPGLAAATLSVNWSVASGAWVEYKTQVFIRGPKGVPVQ